MPGKEREGTGVERVLPSVGIEGIGISESRIWTACREGAGSGREVGRDVLFEDAEIPVGEAAWGNQAMVLVSTVRSAATTCGWLVRKKKKNSPRLSRALMHVICIERHAERRIGPVRIHDGAARASLTLKGRGGLPNAGDRGGEAGQ